MFDMSWNGGGVTIGWGDGGINGGVYGGYPGGAYPAGYPNGGYPGAYPYQQQTTISNGMLLVGAILLYFLLKK